MRTFLSTFLLQWRARRILVLVAAVAALALPASRADAEPLVLDTHQPFTMLFFNPCKGELFAGTGFLHMKTTLATAPNIHVSVEENFEGVNGVTMSGIRYVIPQQTSSHTILDSDFVPNNATAEEMLQLIRQAEDGSLITGDDFFLRIKLHVTVNANGDATANFVDVAPVCQ